MEAPSEGPAEARFVEGSSSSSRREEEEEEPGEGDAESERRVPTTRMHHIQLLQLCISSRVRRRRAHGGILDDSDCMLSSSRADHVSTR